MSEIVSNYSPKWRWVVVLLYTRPVNNQKTQHNKTKQKRNFILSSPFCFANQWIVNNFPTTLSWMIALVYTKPANSQQPKKELHFVKSQPEKVIARAHVHFVLQTNIQDIQSLSTRKFRAREKRYPPVWYYTLISKTPSCSSLQIILSLYIITDSFVTYTSSN